MMRSLFAGVSGMKNHQVRLDVIGNNIANVNTVGYKASRVTFEEAFSQLLQGASRPGARGSASIGGSNPVQVGLGVSLGSIDTLYTQGNLETTGVMTDLAIQGDSLFVLSDGNRFYYTRAGNFLIDATGRLVSATNGLTVQGRVASAGVLGQQVGDIVLPIDQRAPAQATTAVELAGNLDAQAADGTTRETAITVYDSLGTTHELKVVFTKNGTAWDFAAFMDGGTTAIGTGTVTFTPDGRLDSPETQTVSFTPTNGANAMSIELRFGTTGGLDGLTGFGGSLSAVLQQQDGYGAGELEQITIDKTGTITGAYSNGMVMTLAQIALADFENPGGLYREGGNLYTASPNSGDPVMSFVGEGSPSEIAAGTLEMSNVDLAQEFTNMIIAQRGFQSNARVITSSDELLQELVNLKR
jgi:flagellar hook protein FlgE